jgi:hypothetical protein
MEDGWGSYSTDEGSEKYNILVIKPEREEAIKET